MPSRALSISLLTFASMLVPGCCCPQLSGRHSNPCCQPQFLAEANVSSGVSAEDCHDSGNSHCARCGPLKRFHVAKWFTGVAGAGVPSQQGPDYVSPQPKFHPIPTRPAFEPQPTYLPPELIVPSDGSNPLHSTHGHLHGPLHRGSLRYLPSEPAQLPPSASKLPSPAALPPLPSAG